MTITKNLRRGTGALAAAAMLVGSALGWQGQAFAGSDNSSDTYAGDIAALGLPTGTFIMLDYVGWRHGDEYIQNSNNLFGKVGQPHVMNSDVGLVTDITRIAYFASLWNHPLVLEAAISMVDVTKADLGKFNGASGGPQTVNDGFGSAVLFATYGLVVEPKNERFVGLTSYFYLPTGNYDNIKGVNTSVPNQFTWVPQIGVAEGLSKYGLKNFWIDFIANASLHSDGDSPVAINLGAPFGRQQFDKLSQDNSYDIKAFLRYDFAQSFWIAGGIEKSWGGNQTMSGGFLGNFVFGKTSLGKDDFLKGHIEASFPITRDFHVAADFTHDFERDGGVKEDFTAEVRFTKFFIPTQESLK